MTYNCEEERALLHKKKEGVGEETISIGGYYGKDKEKLEKISKMEDTQNKNKRKEGKIQSEGKCFEISGSILNEVSIARSIKALDYSSTPFELTTQRKGFSHGPRAALSPTHVVQVEESSPVLHPMTTPVQLAIRKKGFTHKSRAALAPNHVAQVEESSPVLHPMTMHVKLTTREKRFTHKPKAALAPNHVVQVEESSLVLHPMTTPVELAIREKGFTHKPRAASAPDYVAKVEESSLVPHPMTMLDNRRIPYKTGVESTHFNKIEHNKSRSRDSKTSISANKQ